jgi:hypothetical protein
MANTISVDSSVVVVTPVENNVRVNVCEQVTEVTVGTTGPQGPRGTQLLSGNVDPSSIIGVIGDHYINTDTGKLFGPKTASGWGVGVFLGVNDPNDLGQAYYLTSPSTVWSISHTLAFTPNITIVDLDNNVVECSIEYIDESTIRANFNEPFVGAAYLS